ncbi:MAG: tripartite tricarboxylate transporter substrate binding protein [Betaproteobacteria bacterium]|nr:tripartite tricarboxylate transporter substrate binding protein [Betaproteobacteria bacterium]
MKSNHAAENTKTKTMAMAMMKRRNLLLAIASLALVAKVGGASAQAAWPGAPVRIVVPFGPGGTLDTLARLTAERLQVALGQPVIVENRAGAATRIGHEFVARRPPDGYTLVLSSSSIVILATLAKSLPFDLVRDFEPVGMIAGGPFVLAVNAGFAAKTANEFVAMARAKPGSITYGTSGVAAFDHLAGALLTTMTGIDIVNVPYKGMGEVVQGVLGGQVTATFGSITPLLPHIRSGKLRALGLVSSTRTSLLPGVLPLSEALPLPGYQLDSWMGILAPAGTPRPIIERLNAELNRAMSDPQFVAEKLLPLGIEPNTGTPERMLEVIKSDLVKLKKLASDAKISTE